MNDEQEQASSSEWAALAAVMGDSVTVAVERGAHCDLRGRSTTTSPDFQTQRLCCRWPQWSPTGRCLALVANWSRAAQQPPPWALGGGQARQWRLDSSAAGHVVIAPRDLMPFKPQPLLYSKAQASSQSRMLQRGFTRVQRPIFTRVHPKYMQTGPKYKSLDSAFSTLFFRHRPLSTYSPQLPAPSRHI